MMIPMISFLEPDRLWWLVLIPVLLLLYFGLLRRKGARSRTTGITNLDKVLPKQQAWKRHIAVGAAVLSLAALNVAFAKPSDQVDVPRDRATIVLTLDVSKSMIAEDVDPTGWTRPKPPHKDFLGMLPVRFNVSLVAFAGSASVVVAPTTDRGLCRAPSTTCRWRPRPLSAKASTHPSTRWLWPRPTRTIRTTRPRARSCCSVRRLHQHRTEFLPVAAKASRTQKIPIYTIAYGTEDGYVMDQGRREPVPVNHEELQRVADISGGKKFSADSSGKLKEVYASIAQAIGYVKVEQEVTEYYAGWALGFAVLASVAVIALGARWP